MISQLRRHLRTRRDRAALLRVLRDAEPRVRSELHIAAQRQAR